VVRFRKLQQRAFTLIEAMVSAAITGLAVAGLLGAIGQIHRTNARIIDKERMQRLAYEKIQEIIATEDYNTGSGDFSDRNLPFSWESALEVTGAENVERLSVTITYTGGDRDMEETLYTLVYRPPGVN
jgi:type II secretory pathway pseudopilin PulG